MKSKNKHTISNMTDDPWERTYAKGHLILSGRELQRWNLKFLVHYDRQRVDFAHTSFYVRKIVKYDQIFIYLIILDSCLNMHDLKEEIRERAPHKGMTDKAFFWAHKSYKKELDAIRKKSYHVGESPEDFLDPDMRKRVETLEAKINRERKWLKKWKYRVDIKTLEFIIRDKVVAIHEKRLHDFQMEVDRINRIYNKPDESDPWSDCETTYDDFELYHF